MASTSEGRREIALDTLRRTQDVISSTPGASDRSFFINDQLPSLDPTKCPRLQSTKVHVVGTDSYTAAREIIHGFPEAIGKTAVLNLASDEKRAGGWMESFTRTQVSIERCEITLARLDLPSVGGSAVLFFHRLRDSQRGLLSVAEPRSWIHCRHLLSRYRRF